MSASSLFHRGSWANWAGTRELETMRAARELSVASSYATVQRRWNDRHRSSTTCRGRCLGLMPPTSFAFQSVVVTAAASAVHPLMG